MCTKTPIRRTLVTDRVLLAVFLLCASLQWNVVPASTAQDGPSGDLESTPALTTPALIEQAFSEAEINADQRWLYLAYAVYDHEALPERFHSHLPWWGTKVVREIKEAVHRMAQDDSASSFTKTELARLLSPKAATVCDREDGPNNTSSTHFLVNYGAIGGGLYISHYTTALGTAWGTEITSYGWPAPPVWLPHPPSGNRYPVQVVSLGTGLYGYVTTEGGSYTGLVGNNPNTAWAETAAWASCMVLNSDYSGFPLGALGALQVTAAREFVHSIQFGVGDPSPIEDDIWYKSIAAYMEDEVFDSNNDNYRYLWPNFNTCLGEYSGEVYSDWLFFRYAAERNGGTNVAGGGEEVAEHFWYNASLEQTGLQAYNSALGFKGSNLPDTFHNYAIATRFMKSCPTASPFCYEEAADYLTAAGTISNHGSIASMPGSYMGVVLDNYGLNWVGLPVSGPMTITLQNLSAFGQIRGSIVAQTAGGLSVTPFPAVVDGGGSSSLTSYSPSGGTTLLIAVITNQSQTANDPSWCSPTLYYLSLNQPPVTLKNTYLPLVIR